MCQTIEINILYYLEIILLYRVRISEVNSSRLANAIVNFYHNKHVSNVANDAKILSEGYWALR